MVTRETIRSEVERVPKGRLGWVVYYESDDLFTSNALRFLFEICLVISSALIGIILYSATIPKFLWLFLSITCLSAILFLGLSIRFAQRAVVKLHRKSDTEKHGPSFLTKLKGISIEGPEDFAANIDLYLTGEKSID